MTRSYWYYLKNIFLNPLVAALGIAQESKLWKVMLWSFLLGCGPYWLIVLKGYNALGWSDFPYREYYPHYFSPYWWEMFMVPIWGLVIAAGFGIPCYYLGKSFGGQATFFQVIAVVLLASVVSLPIMVSVDLFTNLRNPDAVVEFAKTGVWSNPYVPGSSRVVWLIQQLYFYVAMAWQGVVTIVGLAVIHRIRWYLIIPGIFLGNAVFFGFLLLIKDYVALII